MDLKRQSMKYQKTKKNFQLPKCFQLSGLTKSLFSCKTTRHPNQDNYVIMDFSQKTISSDNPLTSTMIEKNDYESSNTQPINRKNFVTGNNLNDYYVLYPDNDSHHFLVNYPNDIEETRKITPPVSSMTTYISDYDDVTIVNNQKSPISYKLNQNDDSFEDYFQSTKISQENLNLLSSSVLTNNLSPLPKNKQSTMLHSPIISSKNAPSISTNFLEVSNEMESLILDLSSIYDEDSNTKICTECYEATFVDDVSVQFAETLTILKDDNDDWLYVELNSDKRRGFIPRNIVTDLRDFIYQLKLRHHQINQCSSNN